MDQIKCTYICYYALLSSCVTYDGHYYFDNRSSMKKKKNRYMKKATTLRSLCYSVLLSLIIRGILCTACLTMIHDELIRADARKMLSHLQDDTLCTYV